MFKIMDSNVFVNSIVEIRSVITTGLAPGASPQRDIIGDSLQIEV
jgi:hypothetical protein